MRTFLAYLLLVVFSILIVAGSYFIIICPAMAVTYQLLSTAGRAQTNYIPLFMVIAAGLLALAYGGFYLLIKFHVNTYLTQKIGYGKIVTLGFVLQLFMGLLFCLALLGGVAGSSAANVVIILLLCLPITLRKLIQLTARDRSYDHFLKENPQDQ
jgi:hypothetical protein